MKQRYFAVLNSQSPNVGEMRIYGVIGSYWDDNTANDFVRSFKNLEKTCDRINVHINSPGGSVHEGLPICNLIKASTKEVHTYVDGIAYSMGAMIAISAKKGRVHMAKGSLLMLHSVSTLVYGNALDLRTEADVLDTYDDVLGDLISARTGESLENVKAEYLNHQDHFFSPKQALNEGLIDVIENYEATETPDNVRNMSVGQIAAWYDQNAQEPSDELVNKLANRLKPVLNQNLNNESMFGNKFSKMSALAKKAAGSITAQELEEANAQMVENGIEGVTMVLDSELETVQNENTSLKTDKENLLKDKKAFETSISEKDSEIKKLSDEIAALKGKPAAEAGKPSTDKDDVVNTGEQESGDEEFMTSVDRKAQQMNAK
ncbi:MULTISPECIES: head maturation protease, ClpP-related [Sphingobacterium]|uniref:ATP-dependent Clp protease proteolytic subunit n=1 Tax=Sphingobacterium populi TaxID=1812824 RepID=A0ABW5UB14_9SPHI|nr:head maturation protease, ClpP-related [Sphingobacterium sp. CFCC 11742]